MAVRYLFHGNYPGLAVEASGDARAVRDIRGRLVGGLAHLAPPLPTQGLDPAVQDGQHVAVVSMLEVTDTLQHARQIEIGFVREADLDPLRGQRVPTRQGQPL